MANNPYNLKYTGQEIDDLLDVVNDLDLASTEEPGLMSANDKSKLDEIESGAQENVVESVSLDGTELTPDENKNINIPMDSAPAAGSSNPVKSSGVYSAIQTVASDVADIESKISTTAAPSDKLLAASEIASAIATALVNYYTKNQTYSQEEINALIGAIQQFHYEIYPTLASVTDPASNVLYLIGPTGTGSDKYEEYVYANSTFTKIGDTSIDLSGYSTTEQMNAAITAALQSYTTTENLNTLLAQKANIDGVYEGMVVGLAENLIDTKGDGNLQSPFIRRTSCGEDSIADDGNGIIKEIRGKSLVWNQLIYNGNFESTTGWVGYASIADNIANITATATGSAIYKNLTQKPSYNQTYVIGHIYLFLVDLLSNNTATKIGVFPTGNAADGGLSYAYYSGWRRASYFWTSPVSGTYSSYVRGYNSTDPDTDVDFSVRNFICFDLTLMFGAGNEPTTVAEFEALFPLPYYAYNAGQIINLKATGLETVGFNQWDEEWELGIYNTSTGAKSDNANNIRSKNYIPVIGGLTYYFKIPSGVTIRVSKYDGSKSFLGYSDIVSSRTLTIGANVCFINFNTSSSNTTTYNNDICINLSWSGYRNGEYESYWKNTLPLPITTLTGKLNGEGTSVTIFPDGMKSVGSTYDSITKTDAIKRIGSRAYESGDESDETVVTDGTTTLYVLDTPQEYILDEELTDIYPVADFGTEAITPEGVDEDGVPATAPFVGRILYSTDFTRTVANYKKLTLATDSVDSLLSTLGTAMNGTWSKSWDSTNSKWVFTFQSNS